ncbi:hypothetical protein AVEN_263186-1 [Araneus ventricosus]|uniref:Uncharacterized protein n=1 Tax=Araneus ventricosus TaxID=182803 RepID=A0A4Y2V486_ARAVE|nr:hypothetical protein AVEN_263186-1 [Araneus ventricosus]
MFRGFKVTLGQVTRNTPELNPQPQLQHYTKERKLGLPMYDLMSDRPNTDEFMVKSGFEPGNPSHEAVLGHRGPVTAGSSIKCVDRNSLL